MCSGSACNIQKLSKINIVIVMENTAHMKLIIKMELKPYRRISDKCAFYNSKKTKKFNISKTKNIIGKIT